MLAVTTMECYYINEGSSQRLGLFFCGLTQTCQTNNPHRIFTGLIVLMPAQSEDTVILPYPPTFTHERGHTHTHTRARTHFDTQNSACLTTKQAEETMETHAEDKETEMKMFRASWLKPARQ